MTPTTQVLIEEAEGRSVPKLSNMERLCMALVAGGAPMKSVAVELKVAEVLSVTNPLPACGSLRNRP